MIWRTCCGNLSKNASFESYTYPNQFQRGGRFHLRILISKNRQETCKALKCCILESLVRLRDYWLLEGGKADPKSPTHVIRVLTTPSCYSESELIVIRVRNTSVQFLEVKELISLHNPYLHLHLSNNQPEVNRTHFLVVVIPRVPAPDSWED